MTVKRNFATATGLFLLMNTLLGSYASATSLPSIEAALAGPVPVELPTAPAWGHFVDSYKNSIADNKTVASNPSIGVLSGFLELWTPGDSWDNGTKLNSAVLDANIQKVVDIAKTRTQAEADAAYLDDRRKQSYGAIEGLGSLTDVYRTKAGATTTINDIPADATTKKYDDGGTDAGDPNSELGRIVTLVKTLRGNYSSTNPAKAFYSYMRPFRWANDTSVIVPTLVPAKSATPATDGGFPSGHTNASYLSAYAMAYAVPERFQELMTRASEMGNSRVVAGMHSPLDVIGGRVMATALSAAILADPDNAAVKQAAYDEARAKLLTQTGTAEDRFSDYAKNKAQYTERLTYGFSAIGETTKPMIVPKGAEVLLETRLPYLDANQRREVLATTGLPSGYPVLDDPEGWGRLNLFAAADGYGALDNDVTVTMDAAKGGFHAQDRWRNDIAGSGKLTKAGSGTLELQGNNTYAGGTLVNGGTLEGETATALGTGNVAVTEGTLIEQVAGKMTIGGNFEQAATGTLELNVGSASDVLEVNGSVKADGKLRLKFADGYVPGNETITILTHGADQRTGEFAAVETVGLPDAYKATVKYLSDRIEVAIDNGTAPAWGHFVDTYKTNQASNTTVEGNSSIGVLSEFLKLWKPGSSWDNGTKLNSAVLDANIQKVVDIAKTRTQAEADAAYFDDRRKQSYGAIEGLGSLTDVYRTKAGATTTINDIPADATTKKYDDGGTDAGDPASELGRIVTLVKTLRGNYSSTNPAKAFYSYMRPFRWANDTSVIVPTLVPAKSATPATDGGFPSGHTNASYLSAYAMAYAVPERFQELLTRASEMGNSRVVAGMHSPLDVIGGRVMATALSAAILADPDNAAVKQAAYDDARTKLLTQTGTAEDRFADYAKNKAQFTERLTYGFTQIGDTTKAMNVPKGAEVLLETRLPYLDNAQRREVLATTGLPSGYPVLDDPEGWGRLNLFAAADGYGAFNKDVTVTMDAAKGGFHAQDQWRNNISGTGKLTKAGSGTLKLQGNNAYTGGTIVNGGTLAGGSATAFGTGDVAVNAGTLVEQVAGKMTIGGSYAQAADGALELNVGSAGDVLEVKGTVKADGKLRLKFASNYVPAEGTLTLITHGSGQRMGQFAAVETTGLPNGYTATVSYQADGIKVAIDDGVSAPGPSMPTAPVVTTPAADSAITGDANGQTLAVKATADSAGKANVDVQDTQVNALLDKVNALTGSDLTAELKVEAAAEAKSVSIDLSKAAIGKLADSKAKTVEVTTPFGIIALDKAVLEALEKTAGDKIRFELAVTGTTALSSEATSLVGKRPVVNVTIQSGSTNVPSFDSNEVEIRIPYQPAQGEDMNAIVVSYIDASGKPQILTNSSYNESAGQVIFTTDHLSTYAVSYNNMSFSDTTNHWASSYITYLSARGIASGSGNGSFAPNAEITRAEFAKMLAGIANADVSGYTSSTFSDVKSGDWHLPYVAWAAEQNIVKGNEKQQFQPNARISREEMAVMLKRFADATGVALPTTSGAASFADQARISAWAVEAVSALSQAGLVAGKGNGAFDPQGGATRAEAAKVAAILMKDMME
ncbi:S-layer homology domain-containing protein [Paenibacillus methanolicus]|uniref:Autotransporter-associated beta strand protein n=1 Tax=Paenibacillus methanolicus TaxID=582686 RepID=A0A5S5C1I8_9BACL|nr:S-layer homology domain-containing protein [Paenibacillus methanolicus]TYP73301.1 autotransporter-associated beta strand protein [Paenibacillus methanolicus]